MFEKKTQIYKKKVTAYNLVLLTIQKHFQHKAILLKADFYQILAFL